MSSKRVFRKGRSPEESTAVTGTEELWHTKRVTTAKESDITCYSLAKKGRTCATHGPI